MRGFATAVAGEGSAHASGHAAAVTAHIADPHVPWYTLKRVVSVS
jgi:hypothetical protein